MEGPDFWRENASNNRGNEREPIEERRTGQAMDVEAETQISFNEKNIKNVPFSTLLSFHYFFASLVLLCYAEFVSKNYSL
jgi:hypothetical protein